MCLEVKRYMPQLYAAARPLGQQNRLDLTRETTHNIFENRYAVGFEPRIRCLLHVYYYSLPGLVVEVLSHVSKEERCPPPNIPHALWVLALLTTLYAPLHHSPSSMREGSSPGETKFENRRNFSVPGGGWKDAACSAGDPTGLS